MNPPKIILLCGNPGTGKTWTMLNLIKEFQCNRKQKFRSVYFHASDDVVIVGKYDGSMYQGGDRLSMAVMKDYNQFLQLMNDKFVILEGDRFMNNKVVGSNPFIIKIIGSGEEGRKLRGSNQTERHLKTMSTRNKNITADMEVSGSDEAFNYITTLIKEDDRK